MNVGTIPCALDHKKTEWPVSLVTALAKQLIYFCCQMHYSLFYRTYAFTGLMAFVISSYIHRLAPEAFIHLSISDNSFTVYYSLLWLLVTFCFAAQAIGFFLLGKSGLHPARWKLLLHFILSCIFLFFFTIFNLISSSTCQHMFSKLGISFWTDIRLFVFFLAGSFAAIILQLLFFSGVLIAWVIKTRPYKPRPTD